MDLLHSTMWKVAMTLLFQETFIRGCRKKWCEEPIFEAEKTERRNASTVASMPFQASAPAKSAETFIAELHGTIEESILQYGDVALG